MKPRLLDLFCGAGGCTKGYQRAGFYVVGVDINPMPNYCGDEFFQANALDVLWHVVHQRPYFGNPSALRGPFDAIHASCPCQGYLKGVLHQPGVPQLIPPTRELLIATGLPYVIENVPTARWALRNPIQLCGSSFGLRVWRHRLFETSFPLWMIPPCSHAQHPKPIDVTGTGGPSGKPRTDPGGGLSRKPQNLAEARDAMGIDWMTRPELAEAIPPAMTEWLGHYLMAEIKARQAA